MLHERGRMAFETRNPVPSRGPRGRRKHPAGRAVTLRPGHVGAWHQVTGARGHRVRFEAHCRFAASGEDLVSPNERRSRTRAELTWPLTGASFPGGARLR